MGKLMKIELNKLVTDEKGQAFVLTLILLVVGGLIIAPLMGFMSTGLIVGQVFEKKMDGLYAADAGVEDAIWKIMNDPPTTYPYSYELPADVNEMLVSIVIEEVTTFYTLDVGGGGPHNYYFELESEPVQPPYYDAGEDDYIHEWRLILTNKTHQPVKVERIIVSYSNELSYLSGLTDEDIAGLKSGSFESFTTEFTYLEGITIITWEFTPPRPEIEAAPDPDNEIYTTVTCSFELVGPEDAAGITLILVAKRDDIGTVWDFKPFKITAQANDEGTVVVEAGVLEGSDTVSIGSWQIE